MRPNQSILLLVIIVGILVPVSSRGADAAKKGAPKKDVPKITYDEHIKPIFRAKCGGCHNTDKKTAGLDLMSYTAMMQGGGSGAVITKGSAGFSYLWMVVNHESEPYMPLNSPKLDEKTLNLIKNWIDAGAPENKGSKVMKKKSVDLSLSGVPTGKPEGPPPMPKRLPLQPVRHTNSTNAITAMAASPWAPLVAVGGFQQVLLYNSKTLDLAGVLPYPEGVPQILRFSRNGKLLLAGGGRGAYRGVCALWDITTGKRITTIGDETDAILAADISPDQTRVAYSGASKKVKVCSTKTGEVIYELKKHTNWIYAIEFSPDNVLLATADRNGGLIIWETFTGSEFLVLKGHDAPINSISWRTDSNLLVSCDDAGKVFLWQVESGKAIRSWTAHGGGCNSVEFTRDGRILTCGADRTVKLWGIDGKVQRTFPKFDDIALDATYVAEGDLVVAGDWLGNIRVWNAKDGKQVGTLSPNPPTLETRIATATAAAAAAKKELAPVQDQVAAAKAVQEKMTSALAKAKAAVSGATAAKTKAEQGLATAKAQIAKATKQRDESASRAKSLETTITKLTTGLANIRAAAKSDPDSPKLKSALKDLDEALASRTAERASLKATITKATTQLTSLQGQVKQHTVALAAAKKELTDAQAKVTASQKNQQQAAQKLAAAEKSLVAKQASVKAVGARVQHWQDELAFAKQAAAPETIKNAQASAAP